MQANPKADFQQILCSSDGVIGAMIDYAPMKTWWWCILWLHGKPTDPGCTEAVRISCVAAGFRFYAQLYRGIAVLFLSLAPLFLTFQAPSEGSAAYWGGASVLAAAFLWLASGLGFSGSDLYLRGEHGSTPILVVFMVMITVFLAMFLAAASIISHHAGWCSPWLSLMVSALLLTFGVGSYAVEIVYLAGHTSDCGA